MSPIDRRLRDLERQQDEGADRDAAAALAFVNAHVEAGRGFTPTLQRALTTALPSDDLRYLADLLDRNDEVAFDGRQ